MTKPLLASPAASPGRGAKTCTLTGGSTLADREAAVAAGPPSRGRTAQNAARGSTGTSGSALSTRRTHHSLTTLDGDGFCPWLELRPPAGHLGGRWVPGSGATSTLASPPPNASLAQRT